MFFLALATLEAERDADGANIVTFGDAIWWAIVTIATVGYGDEVPGDPLGRFYAVLLMAGGIAIVGTASATIISYLNERVAGHPARTGDALAPPTLSTGEEPIRRPPTPCRPPRRRPRFPTPTRSVPPGPPGSLSG